MKKLLLLIICIVALAQSAFSYASPGGLFQSVSASVSDGYFQSVSAYAAEQTGSGTTGSVLYARAVVADGYFFTQKDLSTSLFAVPYTYCVQVIREDGEWYYVKYAEDSGVYRAMYGYVLKKDFTPLYERPDVVYLYKPITITYRADEGASSLPVLGEITVEAAFYGTYYSGATAYSYVLCQGSFGYIQGANDDYPLNIVEQPEPDDETEETSGGVNSALVTAIVLVALAAGALILLFVSTRKHDKLNG
ncbi:MAG: hypothetical protein ACI4MH_07645 [Candidatus Coproplasma sp.]